MHARLAARDQSQPNQAVAGVALGDCVAELGERLGDPSHAGFDLTVQAHGRAAEGVAQRQRDAQGSWLTRDRLRIGLPRRWRGVEIFGVVATKHVEHERGVGDGTGEWADASKTVEGLGVGPGGDAPALWLYADQPAPSGRNGFWSAAALCSRF